MRILILDSGGMHASTAKALADEGNEVFYFVPYHKPYAKFKDFATGTGVPGIIKILDPAEYYDTVDLIVFPDVGMGQTCQYLRDKGYPVFGAGKGEEMEQNRSLSVDIMDQYGIINPETTVVKGVNAALDFLVLNSFNKGETNQQADGSYFVKFSIWRGSIDSFPADSLEQTKEMFAKVRSEFGPYADELEIIINKKSEGIEAGADLFFNGQEFIKPCLWGFESGNNYIGYVDSDIPEFQKDYLGKVAEYLKSVNYRGAISTEVIYDGQNCSLIDWTCRFPLPLGLMYSSFISNFGEFLHSIAMGEIPRNGLQEGKYLGIASFSSENALEDWLPVKTNEYTKLLRYIESHDEKFIIPGISTLGCVVAQGDDFNSFQADLDKNCEGVEAFFGNLNPKFIPEVIKKYLEPLSKLGVEFGKGAQHLENYTDSRAGKLLSILAKIA